MIDLIIIPALLPVIIVTILKVVEAKSEVK